MFFIPSAYSADEPLSTGYKTAEADPYTAASAATGIPVYLLAAVAGAESEYHPWALNLTGRQIYCHSRAEAEAILDSSGEDVDIGLMQINWRRWGKRLGVSKRQLLDPAINLLAGARILKHYLQRRGELWDRIGSYHSGLPPERARYNRQVYAAYLRYMSGELTRYR
jgi:soluble lytic murein transglycosylase-like protein